MAGSDAFTVAYNRDAEGRHSDRSEYLLKLIFGSMRTFKVTLRCGYENTRYVYNTLYSLVNISIFMLLISGVFI